MFIKGGLLGTEVMAARCSIMESILEFMVACVWEKALLLFVENLGDYVAILSHLDCIISF